MYVEDKPSNFISFLQMLKRVNLININTIANLLTNKFTLISPILIILTKHSMHFHLLKLVTTFSVHRFCRERFAPPPEKISRATSVKPKKRRKKKKVPSTPLVCGVKIKTIIGQNGKIAVTCDGHKEM